MGTDLFLGAWVAAGLTLCMYTFLYKDNPFFKFAEHLYVGVSIGYTIVRIYYDVMWKTLMNPVVEQGRYWLVLPAILGVLVLARFAPRAAWVSRISFAFIVGWGSGVVIPRIISSFILQQVEGTFRPFMRLGPDGGWTWAHANGLVILVGVVATIFYFFFSIEHRGPVYVAARLGIYFLMVSFGAAFGYTVMARMSLLIGRLDDLVQFAGPEYGYASLVMLVVVALSLAAWERLRRGPAGAGGQGD
jgi:hypothetical protein